MVDPTRYAVGAQLSVEDAKRVVVHPAVPVTDEGMLVGIVRETALTSAAAKTTVGDVMEPPVAVTATEPLANAEDLAHFLDGGPIPVADEAGKLVGVLLP
jgi:CBS domain-containing protein